jgi:hypothetical protein
MSASSTDTLDQLFQQWNGQLVPWTFNGGFVALSYVVSLIGAMSTLELINRRTAPKGLFNQYERHVTTSAMAANNPQRAAS